MGKFKDKGGYDKVIKGRKALVAKHASAKPQTEPKITKQSVYPSKKVQFNLEPLGPTGSLNPDIQQDYHERKKTKSIINTVQFKAPRKQENKSTFLKLKQNQSKYTDIKQELIKQINTSDSTSASGQPESTNTSNNLNFVTHSKTKLTNALLKQILNQPKSRDPTPKSKVKSKTTQLTDIVGKKMINKKDKMGIKKNLWAQKISLIKGQLKDNVAKERRQKAVITGDMQPMLNSLIDTKPDLFPKQEETSDSLSNLVTLISNKNKKIDRKKEIGDSQNEKILSKKERREKNMENEQAKAIRKQSIRFKNSQSDINLFGQLLDFKEFTSNPLETLKKHINAST